MRLPALSTCKPYRSGHSHVCNWKRGSGLGIRDEAKLRARGRHLPARLLLSRPRFSPSSRPQKQHRFSISRKSCNRRYVKGRGECACTVVWVPAPLQETDPDYMYVVAKVLINVHCQSNLISISHHHHHTHARTHTRGRHLPARLLLSRPRFSPSSRPQKQHRFSISRKSCNRRYVKGRGECACTVVWVPAPLQETDPDYMYVVAKVLINVHCQSNLISISHHHHHTHARTHTHTHNPQTSPSCM